MLVFPPGTYQLPSSKDPDYDSWTAPTAFAVCDREVTWESYSLFNGDETRRLAQSSLKTGRDASTTLQDPATRVSWWNANRFCFKVSMHCEILEGDPVLKASSLRLPSENEWEYVASGGMRTPYSFGSDESLVDRYAWYNGNSTAWKPVALKAPNPFGLFDVHGNVSEWTSNNGINTSRMAARLKGNAEPATPLQTFIGGNFSVPTRQTTSYQRYTNAAPNVGLTSNGFRVFQSLPKRNSDESSTKH
jgi:formylglycine-generating enzyme required for sulfatase activity